MTHTTLSLVEKFNQYHRRLLIFAILAVGLLGILLYLYATGLYGIGIRTDSVFYLWGAENLAKGLGFGRLDEYGNFKPITHWPPFYSMILSVFNFASIDPQQGARFLQALLTGALVMMSGYIAARLTGESLWIPLGVMLILLTSNNLWDTTLYLMTESLFLVLTLASFITLEKYIASDTPKYLFFCGSFLGLAFITRYIGFAGIVTVGLVLLINRKHGLRQRLNDIFNLGIFSLLPISLWSLRNYLLTKHTTNRDLSLIAISANEWNAFMGLIYDWIKPVIQAFLPSTKSLMVATLALLLGYVTLRHTRQLSTSAKITPYSSIFILFALLYSAGIIASRLLFDPDIPLGETRIFFPVYICILLLVSHYLHRLFLYSANRKLALQVILVSLAAVFLFGMIRASTTPTFPYIASIKHARQTGLGLNSNTVPRAEVRTAVSSLPNNSWAFTDNLERMYYFTGRPAFQFMDLTAEITFIESKVKEGPVIVALFRGDDNTMRLLNSIPDLKIIYQYTPYSYIIYTNTTTP